MTGITTGGSLILASTAHITNLPARLPAIRPRQVSVAGACGLWGDNSGGTTTYKRIGSQTNGNSALGGFCKMVVDADYNVIVVKDSAGNDVSMSNDYPAAAKVISRHDLQSHDRYRHLSRAKRRRGD